MAVELMPGQVVGTGRTVYPSRQGKAQRWKTALSRQGMSHRHCIRPAEWNPLGDATARDGLWLWNELLATTA